MDAGYRTDLYGSMDTDVSREPSHAAVTGSVESASASPSALSLALIALAQATSTSSSADGDGSESGDE